MVMKPSIYAGMVLDAVQQKRGPALAELFTLDHPDATALYHSLGAEKSLDLAHPTYVNIYAKKLKSPWLEMAIGYTQATIASKSQEPDSITGRRRTHGDAIAAFTKQMEVVNALYRWLLTDTAPNGWLLPTLYAVCKDLRRLAAQADEQKAERQEKGGKLEEASRLLQKCFSCCLNDRTPPSSHAVSRKLGTYYMASLLFKTYFSLKSTALCKNLIKGIEAADLPPFHTYPASHQVTYNYYLGIFAFLQEDYTAAESRFLASLRDCYSKAHRNIELILDFLIPILLLRGVLPAKKTLRKFSRLGALYTPFVEAIKTGDVSLYDQQLQKGEKRLVQRGTYLVVERAREGAVRALMKTAWILENKPARMSIETFAKYYSKGAGVEMDKEEIECLLANLIYKGLIKGYISHEHQLVVLSKDRPFPWYPPFGEMSAAAKQAREQREAEERSKLASANAANGAQETEMSQD